MTDTAQRQPHACYRLDGLPYVPHYSKPSVFVAPGGKALTEKTLKSKSASPVIMHLWPRKG
jgi:hypothetical protein